MPEATATAAPASTPASAPSAAPASTTPSNTGAPTQPQSTTPSAPGSKAPAQPVVDQGIENDAVEDALVKGLLQKHQVDPAYHLGQTAPPDKKDPATPPSSPGETPEAEVEPELAADELEVLKREHYPQSALPTDPQQRREFLDHLRQRQAWGDNIQRQLQEAQKKLSAISGPPANEGYQAPKDDKGNPLPLGQHWESMTKAGYDPELARMMDTAVNTVALQHGRAIMEAVNQRLAQLDQFYQDRWRVEDEERGFNEATFPDGVHKTAEENRKAVLEEAMRLIEAEKLRDPEKFSLAKFNLRHAIPKAVQLKFSKEFKAAAARAKAEKARQQAAGLPDSGASPTTQPRKSAAEQDEDLIRETLKKHGVLVG